MLTTVIVVAIVSAALLVGAAWGIWGRLPPKLEGFLIAIAGGALIVSVTLELIEPSIEQSSAQVALGAALFGALAFSGLDYLVDEKWGSEGGGGLLAAITLDGIPENLALGVALIGAKPIEIAALAGAILLSNLPEAAGGAREMANSGRSKSTVFALWAGAAVLLALSGIVGNVVLEGASPDLLSAIRCLAAGAVVASLATEVFPKAYKEDHHLAGVATALGLVLAFLLAEVSKMSG